MYFTQLDKIGHALIVGNIYNKPKANFASYDGLVIVRGGGREVEVPLTEKSPGSWCVIARMDNSGNSPQLVNINKTQRNRPDISEFV